MRKIYTKEQIAKMTKKQKDRAIENVQTSVKLSFEEKMLNIHLLTYNAILETHRILQAQEAEIGDIND